MDIFHPRGILFTKCCPECPGLSSTNDTSLHRGPHVIIGESWEEGTENASGVCHPVLPREIIGVPSAILERVIVAIHALPARDVVLDGDPSSQAWYSTGLITDEALEQFQGLREQSVQIICMELVERRTGRQPEPPADIRSYAVWLNQAVDVYWRPSGSQIPDSYFQGERANYPLAMQMQAAYNSENAFSDPRMQYDSFNSREYYW